MFGRKKKKYIFAKKRRRRGNGLLIAAGALLGVAAVGALLVYPTLRPVGYTETVEAGSEMIDGRVFLKNPTAEGDVVLSWGEAGEPDMSVPGEYEVKIAYNGKEYTGTVCVVDTVAPAAEPAEVSWFVDNAGMPEAAEFVSGVTDATAVTAAFKAEPDMTLVGSQDVVIVLTDAGGNTAEITSALVITDDQTAPKLYGVKDRLTWLNAAIPLDDGIAAVDDRDPDPVIEVDASAVKFDTQGVYPVVYRAKDKAGNVTEVTANVTVSYYRQSAVDINVLNEAIDGLLAQIVTDDMTDVEKCRAVYGWAKGNMLWSTRGSDKTAWTKEAYRAVRWTAGDSFTTSAFFHGCMLRLGFEDMMVERSGSAYYWNLVNLGDGWFHVDCGRGNNQVTEPVFLLTDEALAACSAQAGGGFYEFDKALYPQSK